MKIAATFLLIVGSFWALIMIWLFLAIAGVTDAPGSWIKVVLYWGGMLAGPLVLIAGAALLLRAASSQSGMVLIAIGCLIFTAFTLYNAISGMQRQPLQVQPPYWLYVALLVLMLLSDMAAYKIYRTRSVRPNEPYTTMTR